MILPNHWRGIFFSFRPVIILCGDPTSVRYIMLKAYEMGFANGEYVFLNVDLFSR